LVRNGEDFWLYGGHHTLWNVFREMFFQVVTDFNVGDFRKLTFDEVEMFYEAGRDALKAATKPTKG
jgi:hypothetical protein